MEGADLIIQEINREAERKIQYILSEAQREAEKLKEEAKKRAEAKAEWILRKAKTQAEMERRRIVANARLEVRKKKLALQEEYIERALEETRNRLANLPEGEYFETLVKLTAEAVEELGVDKVVVRSNERTLRLLAERLTEFREAVGNVEVIIGEPIQTIGGVIVESADGRVRVDNTFEARMERFESELRATIARALFG